MLLQLLQVLRGYPELVNGHVFSGQGSNFFQVHLRFVL